MRKFVIALAAVFIASLGLVGAAGAQDAHIGTIEADPASVPEAGEYTLTANGSGWLPDTSILLTACVSPADTLIPGVSDLDTIVAAAGEIEPLSHCDLATAVPIDVDSDGNFTAELTAEVGDNFFFSAGALDGSQAGAAWIPIVDAAAAEEPAAEEEPAEEEAAAEEEPAEEALAETGVETGLLAVVGTAVLGAGVMVAREARRHR